MPSIARPPKIKIAIDRGGTFTDCLGISDSKGNILVKLLSVDPSNYPDAPTEGIRRILEWFTEERIPRGQLIDLSRCEFIRMGTTVATNALLERKGERHALLTTKGFRDVIRIGNQTRPKLFDLAIKRPDVLYDKVVEVDERCIVEWPALIQPGASTSVDGHPLEYGLSGDLVRIIKPLDERQVRQELQDLYNEGFRSLAIVFMHSYTFRTHEQQVAKIAESIGFEHVSQSSDLQAMIRIVPRANSASADAYLTPEIRRYLSQFAKGFVGHLEDETCQVSFMQSDGSLVDHRNFSGLRAILSGPAGGVVGYAQTSYDPVEGTPVVGFDMGGTSTDVSRYGGKLEHVFETTTAGVTIQSPQLDISTVAAGGGSMLFYRNGLFVVGPDSAGAHPGPACYRKGGPLTVTDANLFLGRLHIDSFPKIFGKTENLPLDYAATERLFIELTKTINAESGQNLTPEAVASGFIDVANETMARPIRGLTEARGYSTQDHSLSCFGGAGGQHASAIASALSIHNVIVHKYSSVLSAYGMALADIAVDLSEPSSETYSKEALSKIMPKIGALKARALHQLEEQGVDESNVYYETYLNLRYLGSDTSMMIMQPHDGDFERQFKEEHRREFSFNLSKPLLVDDIRVRGVGKSPEVLGAGSSNFASDLKSLPRVAVQGSQSFAKQSMYFREVSDWLDAPVYRLGDLQPGTEVPGPALVLDNTQTLVIHPTNKAIILHDHVYIDVGLGPKKQIDLSTIDPILLSVFGSRFMSIAEQMGRTLQKTSISLQIKERLDFSCAVFDGDGDLIANAPAVPVHLGAMSYAVKFQAAIFEGKLKPGDVIVSNMPTAGGSHLPDITVICPVFQNGEIVFWTAARAHHGDIGGLNGNSMPPESVDLVQEGARIYAHLLVSDGKFDEEGIHKIFQEAGNYPGCLAARRFQDNLSDLKAQVSACSVGSTKIQDLFAEYSKDVVLFYMKGIRKNAEVAVRAFLQQTYQQRGGKPLQAIDYMDDGTPIALTITIDPKDGSAIFDFEGTGCEIYGNLNAPPAVAKSAILYCLRCLIGIDIPLNSGCLAPLDVQIPPGTIISPSEHVACSSGNTETSQRVTDVVFKAFEATAASQGCMNVFQCNHQDLAYGETICGGHGAGPTWEGTSGVHINMTNTKMTDAEIFEKRFPIILRQFGIRSGSGGLGKNRGGDGVHREFEFIVPVSAAVIGERRVNAPYGMHGGLPGERGCAYWMRKNPDGSLRKTKLKPSQTVNATRGERLIIHTPGGGGYGTPTSTEANGSHSADGVNGATNGVGSTAKVFWPRANGSIAAYQSASESSQ